MNNQEVYRLNIKQNNKICVILKCRDAKFVTSYTAYTSSSANRYVFKCLVMGYSEQLVVYIPLHSQQHRQHVV